jgi:Putative prokaryotic signal transducing protein
MLRILPAQQRAVTGGFSQPWRRTQADVQDRIGTVAAMDDVAVVKVVSDEPEAQVVCGLLRSAGIECAYRETDALDSQLEDFMAAGPREILVRPADVDAARALLGEG